jgi:hypothetical protein
VNILAGLGGVPEVRYRRELPRLPLCDQDAIAAFRDRQRRTVRPATSLNRIICPYGTLIVER